MKHAFLITAYCEFEALYRQLTEYAAYFDCYVHIDKKSRAPEELLKKLKEIPNVRLIQKYKINWGGVQHVYAILTLLRMAESSGKNYGYYHIMSANSMLIKKPSDFCAFFEENRGKNFLELSKEENFGNAEVLRERSRYFYFQFLYNVRGRNAAFWKRFEVVSKRIQAKLHVNRKRVYPYKGYLYCSLSADFIAYLLSYCKKNPRYLRQLKYCWVCEEFFFQNLIMESEFAKTAVHDSLIYSIWDDPSRKRPATLDMRDYGEIRASQKMFARKIDAGGVSGELFDRLLADCFGQ